MPAEGASPRRCGVDSADVKTAYGQSIQYSLRALISFVQTLHDNNLVLILLGDHQPAAIVSGSGASHDVPITIIAHDPHVMSRISSWGWQDGMLPGPVRAGVADGRVPRQVLDRLRPPRRHTRSARLPSGPLINIEY